MAVACSFSGPTWFALKVRSRAESTVGTHLQSRGFEVFLPTYKDQRIYADRIRSVEAPLFPGYIFCSLDWNNRLPVLSAPHVEYIVGTGKEPTPVQLHELTAVQTLMSSGTPLFPHPFLNSGQRVRLTGGPLAEMEGILVEIKGSDRLVVSVDLLQRSVAAEIDRVHVQPV